MRSLCIWKEIIFLMIFLFLKLLRAYEKFVFLEIFNFKSYYTW